MVAQKLGHDANRDIMNNCRVNLRVMDAFVRTVNIQYQGAFARIMRKTLRQATWAAINSGVEMPNDYGDICSSESSDEEAFKYRWIAGFSGLGPDARG